jgi:hypothetical protein
MDSELIDKLELEKLKLIAIERLSKEMIYPQNLKLSVDEQTQFMYDEIIFRMVAEFIGKLEKDTVVSYPKNWRESFKERWFPRWLKSRYPIRYVEKPVYKVCPHIDIKFRDNPNPHLGFLKDSATVAKCLEDK